MGSKHLLPAFVVLVAVASGAIGCKEQLEGPSPSIASPAAGAALPVDPGIICRMQHPDEGTLLTVSGSDFSPIPFDIPNAPKVGLPDVTLSRTAAVDGAGADSFSVAYGGEPDEANSGLLSWTDTGEMGFAVTDGLALEEGIYDVTITNANGEAATSSGALAVVNRPTPSAVSPGLLCLAEAARAITISGSSFLRIADGQPTVTIGSQEAMAVDALAGCVAVAHDGIDAETCDTIEVTLPQDFVEPGAHSIVVRNPETAACESVHDEDSVEIVVVGPPVIESAMPSSVCSLQTEPVSVTFEGSNFINVDDETFTVTINGTEVTPDSVDGCTAIEVDDLTAETCTSFTVTVDPSSTPQGNVEVGISNPESVGCGYTTDAVFSVLGPPEITSVEPPVICSEVTETITINGSNFGPNATVFVGSAQADSVDVQSTSVLVATFTMGVPEGNYDVTVDNGAGCSGTLVGAIQVDPTPLVFFVDPPVIYNGVSFEVTIFTSGLSADAANVEIVDSNGNVTALTNFQSPTRPNRILATVPSGLAPDTYEVRVTSQNDCVSVFNGTLTITDNLTINLTQVDPGFASPTVDTAITVKAMSPPALLSTPRAYINPNPPVANATATALESTVLVDGETMTSVVPGGLTPGSYDLIVVNPSGEVGLLPQGMTVTTTEPPVIYTVTPQTFANNTDYTATIAGENFDAAGVSVDLECEAPDGTRMPYTTTVNNVTATSAAVTLPTGSLSKGTVCIVVITNNADGSSFTYSAISITNSAFNLEPWTAASSMTTGRRALALEAGRPTRTSRYLYAVGGDDGTLAGAHSSVESSSVDVFGDLGNWSSERYALPAGSTFASMERIGRYLYLFGGNDGTAVVNTTLRAQVLDPQVTPGIVDVDAALGDGSAGLGGGLWMYRVAAVFPDTDASNPLGESLPGEVQNVDLPALSDLIQLTITWEPITGASGYRIYRSPDADASFDELALVAEIGDAATVTWTDDGASADLTQLPLPPGSLGQWHALSPLNTAREAHASAVAQIPGTTDQWVLYAFGGRDGAALASVEYTTITEAADGSQTMAAWTTGTATLDTAKSEVRAFVISDSDSPAVAAGSHWVYVGPGRDGGTFVNGLEAFEVTATLDPGFMTVNRSVSNDRAGYGAGASNGYLYIFGAAGGGPNDGGISAELCETVQGPCGTVPPDLKSGAWNSLGISMSDPRLHADVAQESAFYFIGGGSDGTNALTSIDTTVQ